MSDYTPTTEEVRNDYLCSLSTTELWNDADGRWDRWLLEVKAQAWEEGWSTGRDVWTARDATAENMNPYRQGEEL